MSGFGHARSALVVGLAGLALYATTITPTVGWTDTGELMAVAYTLGSAHPTGYPFMTLLARLWLLLPTGLRVAVELNLLSAVLTAVAAGLFFQFMQSLFVEVRKERIDRYPVPSLIGAGVLATSLTFWIQSSSYEVYALQLTLVAAILTVYARAVNEQAHLPQVTSRWWFAFAYLVGLGFANHLTTVLLAPALTWDYFRRVGRTRSSWIRLGRISAAALVGLTVYLVLPVRASSWPPLNWGDPSTWESFWRHVTGAQYRVWMFSSTEVMSRQWSLFVGSLAEEFVWPWFAVMAWGWFVAWKRWRRAAEFVSILGVTGIVYSINYDIHEVGPYFLIVYIAMVMAAVPGVIDLQERAGRRFRHGSLSIAMVSWALVLWQITVHHPQIKDANPPSIEQFARTVLDSVAPRAVILTGRWDYLYSPTLYLQHVEGVRTDVLLIDHSLLRDRTWYVEGLRRRAPWLDRALADEFEGFLVELRKFERGQPFIPAVIQLKWDALLSGIIRASQESRPVYTDVRLAAEVRVAEAFPEGHLMRLGRPIDGEYRPPAWIAANGKESAYLNDFRDYLASSYLQHAWAAKERGDTAFADSLVGIAASYAPRHRWLAAFGPSGKKLGP